jgi:PAS domain-containing protein
LTDVGHQVQTVLTATGTALGLALVGRGRYCLAVFDSHQPARPVDRAGGAALRERRPHAAAAGVRRRRARHRRRARSISRYKKSGAGSPEQARDRARMEAILAGMVEGVIVVDAQGRLQLVNDAAKLMLKLRDVSIGRQYSETIRVPAIADLVAEVLLGHRPEALQLSPPRGPVARDHGARGRRPPAPRKTA